MKPKTIRTRFFIWITLHTAIVFFLIALALAGFDLYEYIEDPNNAPDEIKEVLVVLASMLVLFPFTLLGAWYVSRRLLRPWQSLVIQAEQIQAGKIEERIQPENPTDEIGRLATTLNKTFDQYQNLLNRLQRFNFDASHQLRNPLAAIRTTGEVCLKHPRTPEEYQTSIGIILEETSRLSRTVNQLLLLARASSGALEEYRTPLNLLEIADEIVREGQAIGELNRISVTLRAEEKTYPIIGVADLLHEAFANLLDNALKFTPTDGKIEISLAAPTPQTIHLEITDTGSGLSPEEKATIFRPFIHGSTRESTGLGLAIVADICRAHAAQFGVKDNPVGGSIFWITFQRADPSATTHG